MSAVRSAQELVWHGMAAQVQLIFGTMVAKLPADNLYFEDVYVELKGVADVPDVLRAKEAHAARDQAVQRRRCPPRAARP